jgi:hypothetical protein
MVLLFMLVLAALCAFQTLTGWRKGIALMVALAAVQDPLRKLVPGPPGWLALLTAPVFVVVIAVSATRTREWWQEFRRHNPRVASGYLLLVFLSLPAAVVSATYSVGSWMLTILGIFSYSVMLLSVVAGFHYPRASGDVRKLLALYCLLHGAMLSGAVLEYLGMFQGSRLIGSKALGYDWIRWGHGYTVDMLAGFYRSADVMGWHAATVTMLSILMGMTSPPRRRLAWFGLAGFAAIALLLCGRRKMVYMIPVFLLSLGFIYWQLGRSTRVITLAAFLAIPLVGVVVVGDIIGEGSANIRYYQGEGIQRTALESIGGQGFKSLKTTYQQSGIFGSGLGFGTPGSHHINVERPRAWQESATSRVLFELGVPGALGFLAVMLAIAARMWRIVVSELRRRTPVSGTVAGLVAFFMANVGSLVVSGQILADPFIASFLGFLVGVVLSAPRLARPAIVLVPAQPLPTPVPAYRPLAPTERRIVEDLRALPW